MKGWSSWNAIGSTVSAEYIKKVADYMVSSGLATKGFKYCNVDEVRRCACGDNIKHISSCE